MPAEEEWESDSVDFSQVGIEDLIDLSSSGNPEYAITLNIEGFELNAANVAKVFRIYEDDTIIEPTIASEFHNNAQYVTTKWHSGYVTMCYVLTDGTIVWSNLYLERPLVSNLAFSDANGIFGEIQGTFSWNPPTLVTGVDGYNIYFLDYWSETIGEPFGSVPKGTNSFELTSDLKVPEAATRIGVAAYRMTEEGPEDYYRFAEIELLNVDNSGDTQLEILSVEDEDSNPGIDGRDFTRILSEQVSNLREKTAA